VTEQTDEPPKNFPAKVLIPFREMARIAMARDALQVFLVKSGFSDVLAKQRRKN
jgi:hypothetical protein